MIHIPGSALTWHDYQWEAEIEGLSARKQDLILNCDTDPFNIASAPKRYRAWGEWFCDLFHRFYGHEPEDTVHLRRIHYRLVSNKKPIPMVGSCDQDYEVSQVWIVPARGRNKKGDSAGDERPNLYQNTNDCWLNVCKAAKWARQLDMIDSDRIIDNRSPDPVLNGWDRQRLELPIEPAWAIDNDSLDLDSFELEDPYLPDEPPVPEMRIGGIFAMARRYSHYIEVWVEKSTMNDILQPICSEQGVTLQTGVGEMSITRVRELMKRIVQLDRPARIFYLSDFDPGGISMPMSVARKIEYAIRSDNPDLDLQLIPLALGRDQVLQYGLPTIPIKETETRATRFMERKQVDGAVELDALEALHPGELARIVTGAIEPFRSADDDLMDELRELEDSLNEQASVVNRECEEEFGDALNELQTEFVEICESTKRRFEHIQTDHDSAMKTWVEKAEPVFEKAKNFLKEHRPQIDESEVPEPDLIRHSDPLMDSEFSYTEQMHRYRRHTGKRNINDMESES